MHKNLVKSARVVPEISLQTDRDKQTHKYVLITILCNCSHRQSKKSKNENARCK